MKNKLLLSLWLLLIFFLFLHPIDSGDFFHNIVSGKFIANNWRLPFVDNLTFTAFGKSWIAHSWGSGLIYFVVYQLLGIPGINILFCFLGLGTVIWLILLAKQYSRLSLITFILLSLSSVTLSLYWSSRPIVMGPFFLADLILFLKLYKKYLYFLPLFFLAWGIFYGSSAILGLLVFGLYLLSVKDRWNKKNFVILSLSLLAACLNGYGLKSLFYGFGAKEYTQAQEWFPIYKFIGQTMIPIAIWRSIIYFAWLVATILIFVYLLKNQRKFFREHFFESLLALGVFAPFISFRYITLVPVFVVPFILLSLQFISERIKTLITWTLLVLTIVLLGIRFTNFPFGFGVFEEKDGKQLLEAVNFMRNNKIYGNIYTTQDLGGYISWMIPESKIFVDTRDDLFVGTDVYRDIDRVYAGKEPITTLLDKYQANIVLGKPSAVYKAMLQNPSWQFIYRKEYFVAIRKTK